MKKEMIFFDVDGTLLNNTNKQVPVSTIKTLHLLKEQGYRIGIATGRSLSSLQSINVMDIIDWDGYVCNNGQLILDKDRNTLEKHMMSPSAVEQALQIAKKLDMVLALKMEQRFLTNQPDKYVYEALKYFNNPIPPVGTYTNQEVEAMIAYGPKGYDYIPFATIKGIEVLPGESTYCDITIANLSKATGIKKILELYNLSSYIAFGDSMNDLEMFHHARFSIAMGQANPKTKELADFITTSVNQDGIYYACKELKLI